MKKVSAHVNITNPAKSGYPYFESIRSFANACDEVVVVDGGSIDGSLKKIKKIDKVRIVKGHKWPRYFDWTVMAKNLQIGYEECKGDWVFHFDADYIFHEDDIVLLRKEIEKAHLPAIEVKKMNFVLVDECFSKGHFPLILNKKEYPVLAYGIGRDYKGRKSATFLRPISKKFKRPDGLYEGGIVSQQYARLHRSDIRIWTYDFSFMNKERVLEQRVRFDKALHRYIGSGHKVTKKKCFDNFISMMKMRHNECGGRKIGLDKHSVFIRKKVANIRPESFGYNGWGLL